MSAAATDWPTVAELSLGFALLLLVVYVALKRAIDGPDTKPARRIPDQAALREFDAADPLAPDLVAAIPVTYEEPDRDTIVDAIPTPLPLEDAELIRCAVCNSPLSSLSISSCWNCSTPNDRSAA